MYKIVVQVTLITIALAASLNAIGYLVMGFTTPAQDVGQMIRIVYFSSAIVPTGIAGLAAFLCWWTTTGYYLCIRKDEPAAQKDTPKHEPSENRATT